MARPKNQIRYRQIVSAAAALMSRNGYKATSCQEIANKTGMQKSTFFHYFRNKKELLLAILRASIDEVSSDLEKIVNNKKLEPEEKLKKALDNHLTSMVEKYSDNVNVYLNELRSLSRKDRELYLEKRRRYEKAFEKIIIEMKRAEYFKGLNSKIVTFGLLGMLNWVPKWYKKDGPLTIERVSEIFHKMVVERGISH